MESRLKGVSKIVLKEQILHKELPGSVRGVLVIVAGNGHSDTSSNPGRD